MTKVKVTLFFVFAYGHSLDVCRKRLEGESLKEKPDQRIIEALERTIASAHSFHNELPPGHCNYVDTHILWRCQKVQETEDADFLGNLFKGGKIVIGLSGKCGDIWEDGLVPIVSVSPPPRHYVQPSEIEVELDPSEAQSQNGYRMFHRKVGGCGCNSDEHSVAKLLVENKGWTLVRTN